GGGRGARWTVASGGGPGGGGGGGAGACGCCAGGGAPPCFLQPPVTDSRRTASIDWSLVVVVMPAKVAADMPPRVCSAVDQLGRRAQLHLHPSGRGLQPEASAALTPAAPHGRSLVRVIGLVDRARLRVLRRRLRARLVRDAGLARTRALVDDRRRLVGLVRRLCGGLVGVVHEDLHVGGGRRLDVLRGLDVDRLGDVACDELLLE